MDVGNSPSPPSSQSLFELPERRPGEPEHHRLTPAAQRARAAQYESPTTPSLVHFWFRTRYISALGSTISHLHPHVLGLKIRPSRVANLIRILTGLLPTFFQSWFQAIFPEWFLPDHMVLKHQKQIKVKKLIALYAKLFDTEASAYDQLKPLQGVVIPTCYGRVSCNGTSALMLEHIGGVPLSSPEGATFRLEELPGLFEPCYRAFSALGACHGDANLSNFQFVDGKIVVLDWEDAEFGLSADERVQFTKRHMTDLLYRYRSLQSHYRNQGLLEAVEE